MTKKRVTAGELLAQLKADPEWVAQRAKQDLEIENRIAERLRAEAPIVGDLRAAGYAVESVWDLVNTAASYPGAVPILFNHLPKPYPGAVREGIARALAVPEARVGWSQLIRLYRDEQEERVKDGLAVAIAGASGRDVIEDLIALALDRRNGSSRILLLSALARSKDPRAHATLVELEVDPETREEVGVIFRRRNRKKKR